jgi:hypothetical protein
MPRTLFFAALLSLIPVCSVFGAAESSELTPYQASIEGVSPMDTTGLDSSLARVLQNYYRRNFVSEENWALVESLRFDGTLDLAQGSLRFTAFKKKPNLCKIVLYSLGGSRIIMSYDGEDAWQLNTREADAQAVDMPKTEALNFIRDAPTGGPLLYPLQLGKKIELLGVSSFDGECYYELAITLPSGEQIRSFLDMTNFAEVRQITRNHLTGKEEVNTYSDFRLIDGIRVPFSTILTVEEEKMHESRFERVQVDLGLATWMFRRPTLGAAAATSGASPGAADQSLDSGPSLPAQPGSLFQVEQSSSFFDAKSLP